MAFGQVKVGINFYPERRMLSYWKAERQASSSFPLPIHNPQNVTKTPEIPIKSPKTCPIPCYLHKNLKKTVAHPLPYQKNSLPLHSLSEREHRTRSLKDCEQEEKDKAALLEREQPSDVNSYRNNKRIKQESLAGQTRASGAARTYI